MKIVFSGECVMIIFVCDSTGEFYGWNITDEVNILFNALLCIYLFIYFVFHCFFIYFRLRAFIVLTIADNI